MYSAEMETLDQLLAGTMSLAAIRKLYTDERSFSKGILGLLSGGDVRLLTDAGESVPDWNWRSLFADGAPDPSFHLEITKQGIARIG
jgi:hypothetical protein